MDTKTEKKLKTLTQRVKDYLKSLGAGPNKIADALKKAKIKGEMGSASFCPLARALKKKFKTLEEVQVDSSIDVYAYGEEASIDFVSNAVSKFVENFDNGKYPALIEDDA